MLSGPVELLFFAVFNCLLDLQFSELYISGVKFAYGPALPKAPTASLFSVVQAKYVVDHLFYRLRNFL